MRKAKLAGLAAALAAAMSASPVLAAPRAPNVILILADDLGIPDVSAYGHQVAVPTPNIDRLAARGVRFTRGYATASVCSPSRAGLLSGQYQQRHGFEHLAPSGRASGGHGLAPEQRLLPEALKAGGYRTAAIGKWHLGSTAERLPTSRGFDTFFGFEGGEIAHIDADTPGATSVPAPVLGSRSFKRGEPWLEVGRWTAGSPDKQTVRNEGKYLTEELTEEAVKFIREGRGGEPYFLYLAHHAPHSPVATGI
jgi:arylsulfatase A-like enzyme